MWDPNQHSNDENVRWSWLRAVEWVWWPLFITQPIIPILLYSCRWRPVILGMLVAAFVWRSVIVPIWVSPRLAYLGPVFVLSKFISAPGSAYLLWQRDERLLATIALFWPLLGPAAAQSLLILPTALVELTPLGKMSYVGLVQTRFLLAVGFRPSEDAASEGG